MATFINLEDSPMFQKQVCSLEGTSDELKDRCQKLHKGVKEVYRHPKEKMAFTDCLEEFGARHDDLISLSIGGPVISKFINTLLRACFLQEFSLLPGILIVSGEQYLIDNVSYFLFQIIYREVTMLFLPLQDPRNRLDKAAHLYDQFLSVPMQVIKQGYLLKRSSSLRTDWKRKFFVLDNHGSMYYYRSNGNKSMGSQHHYSGSSDHNTGVFGRDFGSLGYNTIDLGISFIKLDAEDMDLRLCFRIISPQKTYTLQRSRSHSAVVEIIGWKPIFVVVIKSSRFYLEEPCCVCRNVLGESEVTEDFEKVEDV
ncbi:hypothetical protein CARUB_v10011265mg [Capsella rubella]|uniref:PH domain-containing protein n=1 Tax=Capsella rubella TaxID=81985 RepID=R0IK82_9BRAS|nr:hypothetical protein CARUB_v10011265mg [Capsella rubella]